MATSTIPMKPRYEEFTVSKALSTGQTWFLARNDTFDITKKALVTASCENPNVNVGVAFYDNKICLVANTNGNDTFTFRVRILYLD